MLEKIKKCIVGTLKWGAISLVLITVALTASLLIFTKIKDLNEYKPLVESEIKKSLQAKSVSISHLDWTFSIISLSIKATLHSLTVNDTPTFRSLKIADTNVKVFPLSIWFGGRIKVNAEINKPALILALRNEESTPGQENEKPQNTSSTNNSEFEKWSKRFQLDLKINEASINASELFPKSEIVNTFDASLTLSGFPGDYRLNMNHQLKAHIGNLHLKAEGPWTFESDGNLESSGSTLEKINLISSKIELSKLHLEAMKIFQKPSGYPLSSQFDSTVQLKKGTVETVTLKKSDLSIAQLKLDLSGQMNLKSQNTYFNWRLNKTEVKNFKLPLMGLASTPAHGIVESSGTYKKSAAGETDANWRFFLNNLKINVTDLPNVDKENSQGHLAFSFVNDGSLHNQIVSWPRTEFHFDATDARIEIPSLGFVKEAGNKVQSLIKMDLVQDKLTIRNFFVDFLNAKLLATGHLEQVSGFWIPEKVPLLTLGIQTNRVDLSAWAPYIDVVKKSPSLEGFVEANMEMKGPLVKDAPSIFDKVAWHVKKVVASNVTGSFDGRSFEKVGLKNQPLKMDGPFSLNFIFSGRGLGTVADQAQILADLNLSKMSFQYSDVFRKASKIPFNLNIAANTTRSQLTISKGVLQLHELLLNFSGRVSQSASLNRISLVMQKPIRLENWSNLYPKSSDFPLSGAIQWKGAVGFSTKKLAKKSPKEESLDWRNFSVTGELTASGLNGALGNFKNPITQANAKIIMEPTKISVPFLNFSMGESKFNLSGTAGFYGAGSQQKTSHLSDWIKRKAWDIATQVSITKLSHNTFESKLTDAEIKENKKLKKSLNNTSGTLGAQLKNLFNNHYVKNSRVSVALRVGLGSFADIDFKNLNAKVAWENRLLKLSPFSLEALDGKIAGYCTMDAGKYYDAEEAPEIRSTLKVTNLGLQSLAKSLKPELSKVLGGKLSGEIILASQGFESDSIIKESKGRITGDLKDAYFDSFKYLDGSLKELIDQKEINSFLSREIRREQCVRDRFEAKVDAQINGGNITLESSRVNFSTGSSIDIKGHIDTTLKIKMAGLFRASEKCISGDTRRCLADESGLAALPFKIEGEGQNAKTFMDYGALTKKVAACTAEVLKKKAEAIVKPKIENEVKKLEKTAKDKIKDIFRGKNSN